MGLPTQPTHITFDNIRDDAATVADLADKSDVVACYIITRFTPREGDAQGPTLKREVENMRLLMMLLILRMLLWLERVYREGRCRCRCRCGYR